MGIQDIDSLVTVRFGFEGIFPSTAVEFFITYGLPGLFVSAACGVTAGLLAEDDGKVEGGLALHLDFADACGVVVIAVAAVAVSLDTFRRTFDFVIVSFVFLFHLLDDFLHLFFCGFL